MGNGYKVLIPQDISAGGKNYLLDRGYDITVGTSDQIDQTSVGDYDAILLRTSVVDAQVLAAAKKLKVIGRYGVGLDNIDMADCKKHGVRVTSAPVANILSVAEYTLLMILQCAKNTHEVEGLWRGPENVFDSRNAQCGFELYGKCLGVIGTGKIGSLVAKKAMAGFDMNVIAYDPYVGEDKRVDGVRYYASMDELLNEADIVTAHVPLSYETYHLINKQSFENMKNTAYLINCSRGSVVDEPALIAALNEGEIAGAAIDVFEHEPKVWPNELFGMKNVVVSPHIAGMTVESSDRVGIHAAMGIDDVLNNREPQWPADTN